MTIYEVHAGSWRRHPDGRFYSWDELADALELPYRRGIARVQELDDRRRRQLRDPTGGDNPMIPLLIPEPAELYQKLLLAEAQFDMADILCLAGAYRAETRKWPESLDVIRALLRFRHLPQDPFSGQDFAYRLSKGLPVLIVRVPKWMAAKKTFLYEINIGKRVEEDRRSAEEAIKKMQRKLVGERAQPVPLR